MEYLWHALKIYVKSLVKGAGTDTLNESLERAKRVVSTWLVLNML